MLSFRIREPGLVTRKVLPLSLSHTHTPPPPFFFPLSFFCVVFVPVQNTTFIKVACEFLISACGLESIVCVLLIAALEQHSLLPVLSVYSGDQEDWQG